MGSLGNKPHAVCIPYPAQGHINPMLKLAKLLHHKGFHITFVNTEFNHRRLLRSRGPNALDGLPSFRFETIPDGLPPSDVDATQDIPSLCESTRKYCLPYFRGLLARLDERARTGDISPVSCVVSDGAMSFTLDAAEEIGVPEVLFWTTSACGLMGYVHYQSLVERGYTPLKDETYLTNGYLDTVIDWIPGMKNILLKDLPSFIRTVNPDELMVNFCIGETARAQRGSAVILNTFEALEHDVLDGLRTLLPPIHSIGPLHLLLDQVPDSDLKQIESNLWKEDEECLEWLDSKEPNSVIYVNFGSITVVTAEQLLEFAWGLANSNQTFLWVIRPDLVSGESAILPPGFVEATKGRSLLPSWCPQEKVLKHPAVGGFLTHCGWNSTLESICAGVPMICWPFFAEQQTNCRYNRMEWGIGMEIDSNVKRDEVEALVRELMDGEKGKKMKERAMDWKKKAGEAATGPLGSTYASLDSLINKVLLQPRNN
ncbi:7-deoxyloganetin glucosyltransferase-like [Punica granatum]|uniref:Glycosyltransferase n=1 Tax=Punica granatum TaxID=22663 RepID=A0A6P8D8C0_PUNGR|nr:7-deoxyloganetin glucosyltransferase-like [Punica granatum]